MRNYFSLLLLATSLLSLIISSGHVASPMQGYTTSSNTYSPTQPVSCTTTVTVGGTVVMVLSGVTVTTTFPGPPISAYANTTGVCFTGFIPPAGYQTGQVNEFLGTTFGISNWLLVGVLAILAALALSRQKAQHRSVKLVDA